MTRLRSTFSEIDELFLTTFQRSLAVKNMKQAGDWKMKLTISPRDKEDFECSVAVDKMPSEVSNLSFLQDENKIRFWRLAIDFLILENDGFPGRIVLENGKWVAFPTPDVYASGFSSHLLEIDKIASHLPHQVIAVVGSTSHLSEPGNILRRIRKRIDMLDSLFERTFCARVMGQHLVSLAAEIKHSWYVPYTLSRGHFSWNNMTYLTREGRRKFLETIISSLLEESCRPTHKAKAMYVKPLHLILPFDLILNSIVQLQSITTPKIMMIISISSVTSGGLAVVSYLKSTQQVGTPQDADFFSLVQNSLIQISNIWVMMLTLRNTRLRKHAWIYTLCLVAFGLLSAAVAVPLYLLVPTGWSTLLSAASAISQSLVTLQLVYSVVA
jgi:hypothetical protein